MDANMENCSGNWRCAEGCSSFCLSQARLSCSSPSRTAINKKTKRGASDLTLYWGL